MGKEIYVNSIKISREKTIPGMLFTVYLKGLTKSDPTPPIQAFMKANEIMRTLSYDSSFKIIIADMETRNLFATQLSGSAKDNFAVLERSRDKYIIIDK
jgi:hypothetical protein